MNRSLATFALVLSFASFAAAADPEPAATSAKGDGFQKKQIMEEAVEFFGEASEGLARAIERAFDDYGEPNAVVRGEEAGGAFIAGIRYGSGELERVTGDKSEIYWTGPSIGFDWGGNVSKTFMLIYDLDDPEKIYQRFPGVEGSAYFIGGVGMTYHRAAGMTAAPIRVGVGLRLGANVGYLSFSKERSWVPF